MITLEKCQQLITNLMTNNNFEYFSHEGVAKNEYYIHEKDANHNPLKFNYTSLFPNLHIGKHKDTMHSRYDVAPEVYLMAYHGHGQFKLDLYYHGVSINLYRYYNNTSIHGFMELDLFKTINLDDFYPVDGAKDRHHEYRMICSYDRSGVEFLKLAIQNDTLIIDKTFSYNILDGDGRFRVSFDKDIFEKLKLKHIVFKNYTYSFTDLFNIPSTLESVSFDLQKDKYNTIRQQKRRIITQNPGLKKYFKDKEEREELEKILQEEEDAKNFRVSVILVYESNKGVVITNLYAYNKFKNDIKNNDILPKVSQLKIKSEKHIDNIIRYMPPQIGEVDWWDNKYDVPPTNFNEY